ncbi:MAG: serine hydrolase [Anaerolineae bacterium]|nr:serine hydrolase [Anaerolineae bacterium]
MQSFNLPSTSDSTYGLDSSGLSSNGYALTDLFTFPQQMQWAATLSASHPEEWTMKPTNLRLGTAGDDMFHGSGANDIFFGCAGQDWSNGHAGNDLLFGNQGDDHLTGGSGDDWLIGGVGNDTLTGQSGDDYLWGGEGNDRLDGGVGQDVLNGSGGDDILIDSDGGILTGGQGRDEFRLGDGRLPNTPKITIFPPIPDFTIADFTIGEDQLTLNFGITFDDLTFLNTQNGSLISTQDREGLILLEGVQSQDLTPDSFYFGDAALQTALQTALENAVAESNFPGISISVTSADGSIWTRTQGFSDLENQTPLTSDDRFVIGSVTKVFTATTVLQLAEEGKLSLDDPMSRWVPEIAARLPNGEQITIRQLLGHTSGIRDDGADLVAAYLENPEIAQREWAPEDFLALIYDKEPMGNPGQFGYSNPNYTILGEIVEAVTDSPLEHQFQARIFEPLGLENTFYAYPEEIPGGYVKSYYDENGDGVLEDILSQVHPSLSVKQADGGMVSNPTDLNRFAQALFSGELLSPATLEEMVRDRNPDLDPFEYGLGVMYASSPEIGRLLGHDGAQDLFGWRANMYHLPDAGLTVSITANSFSDSTDPVGDLFDQVLLETFLPSD